MCPYWEVPQEPGQKVSAKLCYWNNFKRGGGKQWRRMKTSKCHSLEVRFKMFFLLKLGRSTCFCSSVCLCPSQTCRDSVSLLPCSTADTQCFSCLYVHGLYLTHQSRHALLEHGSIFSATVLWIAACHIHNRWNGSFLHMKSACLWCSVDTICRMAVKLLWTAGVVR